MDQPDAPHARGQAPAEALPTTRSKEPPEAGAPAGASSGKDWAVLSIDREVVEWHEYTPDRGYTAGVAFTQDLRVADLCETAHAAREAAGGQATRFFMTLGPSLAPLSRHVLPPMKARDLEAVLTRKATQSLGGAPADPRFHASALEDGFSEGSPRKQEAWLLTAFDAAFLRTLERELAREGLTAVGASSRILAGFVHACGRLERARQEPVLIDLSSPDEGPNLDEAPLDEAELGLPGAVLEQPTSQFAAGVGGPVAPERQAHITLLVEDRGVSIGLQEGETLLHVDRIRGDLRRDAGCGAAVVQDLRSLASFFRRESRGGAVTDVVVVGLDGDAFTLLSLSIQKALPNAEIVSSSRAEWLAEAAAPGLRHPRLMRRATRAAKAAIGAAVISSLMGVGVAWRVRGAGLEELARVNQSLASFDLEAQALTGGTKVAREIEERIGVAEAHLERMARISLRDAGVEAVFDRVAGVLDGRARVSALSCLADGNGGADIWLEARTRDAAITSYEQLEEIRSNLRQVDGVGELSLELPVLIRPSSEGERIFDGLQFQLRFSISRFDFTEEGEARR